MSETPSETWVAAYAAAFIEHACERGWEQEDADLWAWDVADDAWVLHMDKPPGPIARADVVRIEEDDSNA